MRIWDGDGIGLDWIGLESTELDLSQRAQEGEAEALRGSPSRSTDYLTAELPHYCPYTVSP